MNKKIKAVPIQKDYETRYVITDEETEISCWNKREANKYPYVCWYNR